MNEATIQFIERLKTRNDVLGIILFGSWARGNNRPDSDVDLLVVVSDGYRRAIEYDGGQAFEIIYTTADAALGFWEQEKDDCFNLWSIAKVVFDKDGTIHDLQERAQSIIKAGKKPIDQYQLSQFQFSAEDEIRAAEVLVETDPITAHFILSKTVIFLTELFFDIRQEWTPAPKQRIFVIKNKKPELYLALEKFYRVGESLQNKIGFAKEIVTLVVKK